MTQKFQIELNKKQFNKINKNKKQWRIIFKKYNIDLVVNQIEDIGESATNLIINGIDKKVFLRGSKKDLTNFKNKYNK